MALELRAGTVCKTALSTQGYLLYFRAIWGAETSHFFVKSDMIKATANPNKSITTRRYCQL